MALGEPSTPAPGTVLKPSESVEAARPRVHRGHPRWLCSPGTSFPLCVMLCFADVDGSSRAVGLLQTEGTGDTAVTALHATARPCGQLLDLLLSERWSQAWEIKRQVPGGSWLSRDTPSSQPMK